MNCGLRRLLASLQRIVEYAPNDSRVRLLGVPDLARFVNVLRAQPHFGGERHFLLIWNNVCPLALLADLATLLRCIIFIGQPALCHCFNFKRVSLCAVRLRSRAPPQAAKLI